VRRPPGTRSVHARRRTRRPLLALLVAAALPLALAAPLLDQEPSSAAPPPAPRYVWGSAPIGGGGYTPGLAIHPAVKDVVYARTDTAGPFAWSTKRAAWVPLLDRIAPTRDQRWLSDTRGMALDPKNSRALYVGIAGNTAVSGLWKSTASGAAGSWTRVFASSGADGEKPGDRIAVDPLNSNIVFYGTPDRGLRRSGNAKATPRSIRFARVAGVPDGASEIVFDPRVGGARTSTKRIYAIVRGAGIYATSDGRRWAKLPGSPTRAHHLALTRTPGELAVATSGSGILRFRAGNWQSSSLRTGDFQALASDPNNRNKLATFDTGNPAKLHVSLDGGASWRLSPTKVNSLRWKKGSYFAALPSDLEFDPHKPGHLWMSDMYGTWRTTGIGRSTARPAAAVTWSDTSRGLENTIMSQMAAPPRGATRLYAGTHDVTGFRWTSTSAGPTRLNTATTNDDRSHEFSNYFAHVAAVGYQWGNASNAVLSKPVAQWNYGWLPDIASSRNTAGADPSEEWYSFPRVVLSTDAGATWTGKWGPFRQNTFVGSAKVAMARNNANNIVYLAWNQVPRYTRNAISSGRGEASITWQRSSGANALSLWTSKMYDSGQSPLTADKHADNAFFLYTRKSTDPNAASNTGSVLRSTDGGATWRVPGGQAALPVSRYRVLHDNTVDYGAVWATKVVSVPEKAGEVWLLVDSGLHRSSNSAASFAKVASVQTAYALGAGKGDGTGRGALYLAGVLTDGRYGLFRSTDLGATWTTIRDGRTFQTSAVHDIEGDNRRFGKLYYRGSMGLTTGGPA